MAINTTIASGESLSSAITIRASSVVGIQFGDGFDGTTLTFESSSDGNVYGPIYDVAGDEVTITLPTFVPGMVIAFGGELLGVLGKMKYLKIRSGTYGSPDTQSSDRTIELVTGMI